MTPHLPTTAPVRTWLTVAVATLVLVVLVRALLVQSFSVPSGSMEPLLQPGDRVLANRLVRGDSVERGRVVVFDGATAWGDAPSDGPGDRAGPLARWATSLLTLDTGTDYGKRVVGVAGDHVSCCEPGGRLAVNGVGIDEPYLHAGDRPSELTFDVTVPPGRIWVMGDHRSDSADSRAYLGRPGGGMVPVDDVIGQVTVRYWPLDRLGSLGDGTALSSVPSTKSGAAR